MKFVFGSLLTLILLSACAIPKPEGLGSANPTPKPKRPSKTLELTPEACGSIQDHFTTDYVITANNAIFIIVQSTITEYTFDNQVYVFKNDTLTIDGYCKVVVKNSLIQSIEVVTQCGGWFQPCEEK